MTHVWQTYVASQGDIKFALRQLWANKLYLKIALPAPDHTANLVTSEHRPQAEWST